MNTLIQAVKNKWAWSVLALVLVVAGVLGGVYYWGKPKEMILIFEAWAFCFGFAVIVNAAWCSIIRNEAIRIDGGDV